MDLFRMKCLISVGKHQNYSRAAEELYITQPAVTAQMNSLEKELGIKLLNKNRRKIELTPEGILLAQRFEEILRIYHDTLEELKYMKQDNILRVGYHGPVSWARLEKLFAAFQKENPDALLDLKLDRWPTLANDVEKGELDIFFTEESEIRRRKQLVFQSLFLDDCLFCIPSNHRLSRLPDIEARDLKDEQIILNEDHGSVVLSSIRDRLVESGLSLSNVTYVNQLEVTIMMAASGMGITPVPRSFKTNDNPSVVYVPMRSDRFSMDMGISWHRDNHSKLLHSFISFCKNWSF